MLRCLCASEEVSHRWREIAWDRNSGIRTYSCSKPLGLRARGLDGILELLRSSGKCRRPLPRVAALLCRGSVMQPFSNGALGPAYSLAGKLDRTGELSPAHQRVNCRAAKAGYGLNFGAAVNARGHLGNLLHVVEHAKKVPDDVRLGQRNDSPYVD